MKQSAIVGTGAMLGAVVRYALTTGLPASWTVLLLINALGCFFIAFLAPRPFWTTGFLGGFTSYSAFQLQLDRSLLPLIPMLAVCILAYLAGNALQKVKNA